MNHFTQAVNGRAITPSLTIENGQVTTTSLQIAEHFSKSHNLVLRAIRNLECSDEFALCNFAQGVYTLPETGNQQHNMYRITRDGFVFLAMGFTGKEAAQWKEAYITAFNRMESTLAANATPTTISNAQQQHLHELVDIVVASGKQTHGETWKRLHRKFHVSRYEDLPADQFNADCQYLRGKVDGNDISTLVKKHFPTAAPALPAPTGIERMLITKDLATGETTVENLGTSSLLFKSPDHVARAVMDCRLGVEVTQKIAQHAMFGMVKNTHDLKKQIRSQAITETLNQMASLPVADLVELSTSAHTFLSGMALKNPPLPAVKGDRLMEAALSASAHA